MHIFNRFLEIWVWSSGEICRLSKRRGEQDWTEFWMGFWAMSSFKNRAEGVLQSKQSQILKLIYESSISCHLSISELYYLLIIFVITITNIILFVIAYSISTIFLVLIHTV